MRHRLILLSLVLILAVITLTMTVANDTTSAVTAESEITIEGAVTARNGDFVTIRTDDGKQYTIDARNSAVLLDKLPEACVSLLVGDRLRAFGRLVTPNTLLASKVRIFPTGTQTPLVVNPPTTVVTPPTGTGPSDYQVEMPGPGASLGNWRTRALVVGVDYANRRVSVVTSQGPYDLDARVTTVVDADKTVPLTSVSQGDALRVWGEVIGLNKVRADRIEVIRSKENQAAAVPLKTTSFKGQIVGIDFPSFTFRVRTDMGDIRVLADENTFIHFNSGRKAFQDMAIGQMVKVAGVGSLGTGYVATDVLIIGGPS